LSAREEDVAEHSGAWSPFSQQNRLAWEEIADVRTHRWSNRLYTAEFFAAGGCSLDQRVVDALGQLDAARVLHLMCSTGEESLSLAVLGARVLAVDISERQLELARSKAQAAGVRVDFAAADIGALPVEIAAGGFDVVYTGGGVLVWVPDISIWAAVVAGALRPGGRLVLWDFHPVASAFEADDDEVRLAYDYFGGPGPTETRGWTHFAAGGDAQTPKYEFRWTLGEIVTALADAGLRITALREHPSEADWQFGGAIKAARRLPGQLLLVAQRLRS
jgi:SAM-dependent methyltransferase